MGQRNDPGFLRTCPGLEDAAGHCPGLTLQPGFTSRAGSSFPSELTAASRAWGHLQKLLQDRLGIGGGHSTIPRVLGAQQVAGGQPEGGQAAAPLWSHPPDSASTAVPSAPAYPLLVSGRSWCGAIQARGCCDSEEEGRWDRC